MQRDVANNKTHITEGITNATLQTTIPYQSKICFLGQNCIKHTQVQGDRQRANVQGISKLAK